MGLTGALVTPTLAQVQFHAGDVNCDSTLSSVDIIYLVNYIFKSGPIPCGSEGQALPNRLTMAGQPGARTPWQIDTLRLDDVRTCTWTNAFSAKCYLHNHDSLYTLIIPLSIETVSGSGFVRFDSLKWIDRLADTTVIDIVFWRPSEVDGVSPDSLGFDIGDALGAGKPPLDSGAEYLFELFFTPIGGPSTVQLVMDNWLFIYEAHQFDLIDHNGTIAVIDGSGTGDLNCDATLTAIDIIMLVNVVFRS